MFGSTLYIKRFNLHQARTEAFNRNLESEEVFLNMDIEQVKTFMTENAESEEVKKFIDSLADKRVGQAIKTYQEKTEREKLQGLQQEIEKLQFQNQQNQFKELVKNMGVPEQFTDFVIKGSEEETKQAAEAFLTNLKTLETVNRGSGATKFSAPSTKSYANMTPDEIFNSLPKN